VVECSSSGSEQASVRPETREDAGALGRALPSRAIVDRTRAHRATRPCRQAPAARHGARTRSRGASSAGAMTFDLSRRLKPTSRPCAPRLCEPVRQCRACGCESPPTGLRGYAEYPSISAFCTALGHPFNEASIGRSDEADVTRHQRRSSSSASAAVTRRMNEACTAGGTVVFAPLIDRHRISFSSRSGAMSASARFIRIDASAP